MLKLKKNFPTSWEAQEINRGDFEIANDEGQCIADVHSNGSAFVKEAYPTTEEAELNAKIIKGAPKVIQDLIDVRNQIVDGGIPEDSVLIISIDEGLKEFCQDA